MNTLIVQEQPTQELRFATGCTITHGVQTERAKLCSFARMLELLRTMSRYAKFLIRHAHLLNATVDLKPLRIKIV